MKLPNGDQAMVEIEKLKVYCLNPEHPRGRHKARVFLSALGLSALAAEELKEALLAAAKEVEAEPGVSDLYGTRYVIDFQMNRSARMAWIRSSWIVRHDQTTPRFVTCYVLR